MAREYFIRLDDEHGKALAAAARILQAGGRVGTLSVERVAEPGQPFEAGLPDEYYQAKDGRLYVKKLKLPTVIGEGEGGYHLEYADDKTRHVAHQLAHVLMSSEELAVPETPAI